MNSLIGYAAYVPDGRLARQSIKQALGSGGGKGTRAVAGYDEDSTTLAVEAARRALRQHSAYEPTGIWLATTTPPYLDKTNATAVHAALNLDAAVAASDVVGSVRSGLAAVDAALATGGTALLADLRNGLPGSAEESAAGDGAVALLFGGDGDAIAVRLASVTSTGEFLDRWRAPGDPHSQVWEERFGEIAYAEHVASAWTEALKAAKLTTDDLHHVVVTGLHSRATAHAARSLGVEPTKLVGDRTGSIGNTGTAHWGLLFADTLDRAEPQQVIAVVTLADGCHVQLWRTTAKIEEGRASLSVDKVVTRGRREVDYARFLTWRGYLARETPRRPEPERPAAPPSRRAAAWKFGLNASSDESGFVHMPPARVSLRSGSLDAMARVPMDGRRGRIATYTVDHLAYSMSPPVVAAVVDFDGGGRFPCELTDVDPESLAIGDTVEMTFRRLYSQGGVHNYFWKARPVAADAQEGGLHQ
jgi:hydroxymethylglutaryl-CoA synthase